MKNLAYFSVFLAIMMLISGCAGEPRLETTVATSATSTFPAVQETTLPVCTQTQTTATDDSLGIDPGSYRGKYTDPNSNDFLEYYTFVPENAEKNMPLILFLHGDGEIGRIDLLENIALVDNAKEIYGDDFPFIAIAPCKRQKSWCEGFVPKTILGLLEEIIAAYEIDRDRVIITGFSSGAMGTWYMITNHTDLFSAAVPISCPNEYPVLYDKLKTIPIWGFVGELEEYYTGKMAEIIHWTAEIGGDARLTILEDMAHKGMDKASYTQEVIDWMLAQ